ncbi:MAG: GNAT family N-acetyltransferase [Anaerolineales bacterium]|nr:GNAT family N-acetyltransferase [Anaerolineales bacterium]
MNGSLFTGERVRLTALDPDQGVEAFQRWSLDSELGRLLSASGWRPTSRQAAQEDLGQTVKPHWFPFLIHTLAEDRLIGMVDLDVDNWNHRNGWIGIGLGERATWGQGYGTDAMRLIVRYGFQELDLYRITLTVFEYNPRAVRSYEKVGFEVEGRLRQALHKDGRRADILVMGLRRANWERPA